ncbi:MAG: hypothetical protein SOV26_04075 [Candidatus Onthovivens sp.]|nr:hypothetical protein [Candidatus Onthovivens sp.]
MDIFLNFYFFKGSFFRIKIAIGGYSGPNVKPIVLRCISDIAQQSELKNTHISAMSGVENYIDALDFFLLSANTIEVTTSLMIHGYRIIHD